MLLQQYLMPTGFFRAAGNLLFGFAAIFAPALAQAADAFETFNALTEIKVEAQRVSKMHVAQSLDLMPQRARRIETAAVAELRQFTAQAAGLLKLAEFQPAVKRLNSAVAALEAIASQPVTRESAATAARAADTVTAVAEELLAAQQQGGSRVGKLIATAAKAHYLSQRVARNHLIVRAGVKTERNLADQLKQDRADLAAALKELGDSPLSTKTLQQNQPLIMAQWTLLNAALGGTSADSSALEDVVKTSERLFEMLEDDLLEIQRIVKSLI